MGPRKFLLGSWDPGAGEGVVQVAGHGLRPGEGVEPELDAAAAAVVR